MSDVNGWFGAQGYGNAEFYVTHIAYGVETVHREGESATQRTMYFRNVINDNFIVSLVFNSWDAYQAAANWFRMYMTLAADPNSPGVSPMVVQVPSRNFYGVGIPETGVSFGDHVPAITYPMNISFTGTQDAYSPNENDYAVPTNSSMQDAGNPYFYPLAVQLQAGQDTGAQLYDNPVVPIPAIQPTPQKPN